MIMSINDIIQELIKQTGLSKEEIMADYHVRFKHGGLSSPVNDVGIEELNYAIELSFNRKNILKGIDDGDSE